MTHDMQDRTIAWVFEHVYKVAHRAAKFDKMLTVTAEAVESLHAFHGGDVLVSEVTPELLRAFARFLRLQRFSNTTAYSRRGRIKSIVAYVVPQKTDVSKTPPADGSLREFVAVQMPEIAGRQANKQELQSVNAFCRFMGSDVAVDAVTPEDITTFTETMKARQGEAMASSLRRIMRMYDPVRFRMRQGRIPTLESEPASDSRWLLVNIYKDYESSRLRNRAESTRRLYRNTLLAFERFLGRRATLDDLNDATLDAFAAVRGERVVKSTVNRDLYNLAALWRWCADKCIVDDRPGFEMEKVPRRVPVAWREAEMRQLMAAIRELPGRIGLIPACDWWASLVHLLWDSGERIGAVVSLDWSCVDLKRRSVVFVAESRKGGADDNAVELSDETVAALRRMRADAGPVFPWPFHKSYLWQRYGAVLRRAGLPDDRKRKFHCIRKTVGSYVEAAGGNATAVLRHSDRRVTERYLDPTIVKRQQPVDLLFRLTDAGRNAALRRSATRERAKPR